MKIIQITLILIFSFISSSLAKEYIKDFDFNDADFIQSKYDVKYFINDGYKIVQQETKVKKFYFFDVKKRSIR